MSARVAGALTWVRRRAALWQWALVGLLTVLLAVDLARVWGLTNHHDLDVFLLAARRLVAGEDLFADAPPFKALIESGAFSMQDATVVWPYMYAPLIALLLAPAVWLPSPLVQALWWAFNVAALLGGTWLCLRAMGRATPLALVLGLLIVYRFDPAIITLRLGQIELAQFLLLALTLYALSRGEERWAGVALGVATGLKFFPGALIALLAWKRRWRAAAWATGIALFTILGSFAVVGLDALPRYLGYTSIYGIGGAFAAFPYNQSFNGFFSRNLIHNVFTATLKGVNLPDLARLLTLLADGAIILASAALTWPSREGEKGARFQQEFALGVMALLLVSPHAQVYTFVWAILPLVVLAAAWLGEWPARSLSRGWIAQGVALGAGYLLVGRHFLLFHPGLTRFAQSHYLFGALLLWGLLAYRLGRRDSKG